MRTEILLRRAFRSLIFRKQVENNLPLQRGLLILNAMADKKHAKSLNRAFSRLCLNVSNQRIQTTNQQELAIQKKEVRKLKSELGQQQNMLQARENKLQEKMYQIGQKEAQVERKESQVREKNIRLTQQMKMANNKIKVKTQPVLNNERLAEISKFMATEESHCDSVGNPPEIIVQAPNSSREY